MELVDEVGVVVGFCLTAWLGNSMYRHYLKDDLVEIIWHLAEQ